MSDFDAWLLAVVVAVIVLVALGCGIFLISYHHKTRQMFGRVSDRHGKPRPARRTRKTRLAGQGRRDR